ncbi:C6 transcription protein [Penicillium waksmanii]|uniref:C6 transcription protein n=1 Tax=Penicillium waksmanii TaxID=69791 RepID=UPI00254672DD|nr:C6 transcription protein [Penicillium waksmanii]KAJ5981081.1 C6 transcription protein [Penicillium waksmanii]
MQRRLDIAIEPPLTAHGSSTRTPTKDKIESVSNSDSIESADEMPNLETEFGRLAMGNGRSRYMIGNYWASLDEEVSHLTLLVTRSFNFVDHPIRPKITRAFCKKNRKKQTCGTQMLYQTRTGQIKPAFYPSVVLGRTFHNYILHERGFPRFGKCSTKLRQIDQNFARPERGTTRVPGFAACGSIPKGLEALMMAVYFNVVVSLSPEQCLQVLGCDRVSLIQKFNFASEQALARAGLLETDEIIVLQAFAIFPTAA